MLKIQWIESTPPFTLMNLLRRFGPSFAARDCEFSQLWGGLVGILTQKDLLDSGAVFPAFESKKGRFKTSSKIASVLRTSVITLKPSSAVRKAAELMLEKNIGRIPIVDEKERLVGIVDREDVVKAML